MNRVVSSMPPSVGVMSREPGEGGALVRITVDVKDKEDRDREGQDRVNR